MERAQVEQREIKGKSRKIGFERRRTSMVDLYPSAQEDFMKLFDRGTIAVEAEKDALKRPLPAAFTQFETSNGCIGCFRHILCADIKPCRVYSADIRRCSSSDVRLNESDPASKRPLPILPQMQNNMLTHQQLMHQAALQAAMQARTLPSSMQNSYLTSAAHLHHLDNTSAQQLRPLDPTAAAAAAAQQLRPIDSAQQIRQMDQNAAAAAAYGSAAAAQQYRSDQAAMAQQLQRQLPTQMLQNQALQMRNQQMTMHEYHNLLRLSQQTASMPARRQTIAGTSMSPQMSGTVPRLQRPTTTTMAPPYSTALQYPHQMTAPLSSLPAPPISLATPIPIQQQQSLFAQQLMSNAMRATASTNMAPPPMPTVSTTTTSQPQTANNSAIPTPVNSSGGGGGGGVDDAEFLAFLENVRQIEAHLTRTLAESIQRSTATEQSQ
ncbi:hypothetical protein Q1695_007696 [Nippostrongylus brasiliensis]|nr:hypothetical protein Q1695_007696 [Nippostrongylus brasiliensis]